jgi:hypothetical protein
MPRRHSWDVEQDGRRAVLRPGEFAFVDLSRPFRMTGRMHDFMSVVFPRALLPLSHQETGRVAGDMFGVAPGEYRRLGTDGQRPRTRGQRVRTGVGRDLRA